MNKIKMTNLQKQMGRIHPLVATAAVAVTLVSLVGIAAITGVIPTSQGTNAPVVAMNNQTPLMTATPNEPYDNRGMNNANTVATQSPNYVPMQQQAPVRAPAPVIKHAAPRHVTTNNNYAQDNYQVAQGPATCSSCGRVESVVALQHAAQPSGLGIAAGAVLGGVLGNQVGGGNGRTLATVAGAVAGGYGGNEVEKRTRSTTTYQVRVRMESGEMRTFPQDGQDGWRVGDRVRVVNGALTSRG
jgi:outer membrane lipoprotein SlyB